MLHHVFLKPDFVNFRSRLASAANQKDMEEMVEDLHTILLTIYG